MSMQDEERLWLSAERGPVDSHYTLTLVGRDTSLQIGRIQALHGGGWRWTARLGDDAAQRSEGEAPSAAEASEQQFDALCRIAPDRFSRIAA